jgi:hypothetical protein
VSALFSSAKPVHARKSGIIALVSGNGCAGAFGSRGTNLATEQR